MKDNPHFEKHVYNNLFTLVTEQLKHVQDIMVSSENILDTLLNVVPVGIIICTDPSCQDMRLNPIAGEYLRSSTFPSFSPAPGEPQLLKLLHRGRPLFVEELPIHHSIRAGEPVNHIEIDLQWEDGVERSLLWSSKPLHGPDGKIIGAMAVFEDISELKGLRENELYMRLAVKAGRLGTFTYYLFTGVANYSPEFRLLMDYDPDEPLALELKDLERKIHPQDKKTVSAAIAAFKNPQGDGVLATDFRICCRDGTTRWLHAQGLMEFILSNGSRVPLCASGVLLDITDRVKKEQLSRFKEIRLQTLTRLHYEDQLTLDDQILLVLETALHLTQSRTAYFCQVDASLPAAYNQFFIRLSDDQKHIRNSRDAKALKDIEIIGSFLPDSPMFMANDINISSPSWGDIKNLLIVPIRNKNILTAVIAVANKNDAFETEDQLQLRLLFEEFMDIVLRKEAEDKALEQEHYFKMLMENSQDLICVFDTSSTILFISNSVREALGYEPEEVIGKNLFGLLRPANMELVRQLAKQILFGNEKRISVDVPFESNTGEQVLLELKIQVLQLPGTPESIMVQARDVTAVRKAEQQLKETLDKYAKLLSHAADAIIVVDAETGLIVEVNQAAEKLLGIPMEQLVGMHHKHLYPEENRDEYMASFKQRIMTPQDLLLSGIERYIQHSDGSLIPVEIRTSKIEHEGRVLLQGIFRDLTDRKLMESYHVQMQVEAATREAHRKLIQFKKLAAHSVGLDEILYSSDKMREIVNEAHKYNLDRSISILLLGETGTGKDVIARLIHYGDLEQTDRPFVAVNCAAINRHLFESEFFGYEAGSFTGGLKGGQIGKFDSAKGGTIFLDEISEIPCDLQSKLLRVIDSREFYRVGGHRPISTDVRIICASNVDLNEAVKAGTFRKDLYYRLCVGLINIPPLRDRGQEILDLALHFLRLFARQKGKRFDRIHYQAADILLNYSWPGNVRELRNLIEWVAFMFDDVSLLPDHLDKIKELQEKGINPALASDLSPVRELSLEIIRGALDEARGNKLKAANLLGISRPTLYKYMKLYNL